MRRGMALGKFMPPHRGHEYMIHFAQGLVDELTVLVCSLPNDPIPGALRYEWMRRHFGGVQVVHCEDLLPQTPEDDAVNFWNLWRETVLLRMDAPPDFVFASESYGVRLAQEFGAQFVPVDPAREINPISATMIRSDPARYADYLIPEARAHYVKRVVLVGPESSGKSTLTKWLAARFQTAFVSEYGADVSGKCRARFNAGRYAVYRRGAPGGGRRGGAPREPPFICRHGSDCYKSVVKGVFRCDSERGWNNGLRPTATRFIC